MIFHLLQVARSCIVLDYSGIVGACPQHSIAIATNNSNSMHHIALIVGSFFPSIYYGFYCYPGAQKVYMSTIAIAGFGTRLQSSSL